MSRVRTLLQAAMLAAIMLLAARPANAQGAPPAGPAPVSDQAAAALALSASPATAYVAQLQDLAARLTILHKAHIDAAGNLQTQTGLDRLLTEANDVETQATAILTQLAPYQTVYKNLLDTIGPPPGKGDPPEPANIAAQRANLTKSLHGTEGETRQAQLYALEAHELSLIMQQDSQTIQKAQLFQRFSSPLSDGFWSDIQRERDSDRQRLSAFHAELGGIIGHTFSGSRLWRSVPALIVIIMLPFLLPRLIEKVLSPLIVWIAPPGRIHRSLWAVGLTAIGVLIAWVIAKILSLITQDVSTGGSGSPLDVLQTSILICGYVIGIGSGLLAIRNGSWRMLPLSDSLAVKLRLFPIWLAAGVLVLGILQYMTDSVGLGIVAQQLVHGTFVLLISPLLLLVPRHLRAETRAANAGGAERTVIASVASLLATATGVLAVVSWLLVGLGYIPFAFTLISWLTLMVITVAGLYLAAMLTEDLAQVLVSSRGALGRRVSQFGIRPELLDQVAVLIAGIAKAFLIVCGIAVAEAMGNFDPQRILAQLGQLFEGEKVGGLTISLNTILEAALVLVAGSYIIRVVRNWLHGEYFPKTRLDVGAQTSVITIFTYVAWFGVGVATLATAGITTKNLAWVVSALSVGIGFGLQAIVQNFVSGIILLAERPVKVGDTVELSGSVGDVRRISVRSTQIKLGDGSILIVPNSQIITSTVRNLTAANPLGQLSISMQFALGVDIDAVFKITLDAFTENATVLDDPKPAASVSAIDNGLVTIAASGSTRVPREVDGARAAILLVLYRRLTEAGLSFAPKR